MRVLRKLALYALAPAWGVFAFCGAEDLADEEAWLNSLLAGELEAEEVEEASPLQTLESLVELDHDVAETGLDMGMPSLDFLDRVWSFGSSASLASGFAENVLFSEDGGLDSPFGLLEGELFAMRSGRDGGHELVGLLYGEYKYYEDVPGVDSESLGVVQFSAMSSLGDSWAVGGFADGVYSVQAFDASLNDFETEASTVRSWRPKYGLRLERSVSKRMRLEGELYRSVVRYGQSSEDYDEVGFAIGLAGAFGQRARFDCELLAFREDYHERLERASLGSLQDADTLEISGYGIQAQWERDFSHPVLKQVSSRALFEGQQDAVGDYYGRSKWELRQSVDLEVSGWEVELSLAYEDISYRARRVSLLSDAVRQDDAWRWRIEGTRSLSERFDLYFRLEAADKKSNGSDLSYETSGGVLGIRVYGGGES